jgi:hypothetical protein
MWLTVCFSSARATEPFSSRAGGILLLAVGALAFAAKSPGFFPSRGMVEEAWNLLVPSRRTIHQRAAFTHGVAHAIEEAGGGKV